MSLVAQTREILLEGIRRGRWRRNLPGERVLVKELQVGRGTLRRALAALARERRIFISQGKLCAIAAPAHARSGRRRRGDWQVGMIVPEPLWRLRPASALWIDALRTWLRTQGADLHLYDGARYFGSGCASALEKLTRQSPHDCWSLLLSTHAMQQWFQRRGLPVVVVGSTFADLDLPSVDLAHRAIGRHAAGTLLARGHRRIACLSANPMRAGVIESERGFVEAFVTHEAEPIVSHHLGATADICRALDRLRRRTFPPTALFLQQSSTLLTTLTYLAQAGVAVPRDLSVIVAEDEPYIRHLVPEVARYSVESGAFTRRVCHFLKQAAAGALPPGSRAQIMPTFVAGGTIARCSAGSR